MLTKLTQARLCIAILPFVLLNACAHDQQGIAVRTVEVPVETQRPCPGTQPIRPSPLAKPLPTDLAQLAATLAAKLGEYALPGGYADQADAIMKRCLAP